MNRERLGSLAAFLRAFPSDLHFNLAVYAGFQMADTPYEPEFFRPAQGACGVVACPLGYAALLPEFMDAGLRLLAVDKETSSRLEGIRQFTNAFNDRSVQSFHLVFQDEERCQMTAASRFFGLSFTDGNPGRQPRHLTEYYNLFEIGFYPAKGRTGPMQVAMRLERYMETGKY